MRRVVVKLPRERTSGSFTPTTRVTSRIRMESVLSAAKSRHEAGSRATPLWTWRSALDAPASPGAFMRAREGQPGAVSRGDVMPDDDQAPPLLARKHGIEPFRVVVVHGG